ncbi:hypothetical protein E8E13_010583 [Curvularia kusanoi]|uniref:Uncharacterized protein n=1 Tax=Curvularia kusanoi TaxID=90978 RepID=A0A9P4TJM4_CURKU|nr:hypothetical protein E8E13_010583 [Curvularia kusanoi]
MLAFTTNPLSNIIAALVTPHQVVKNEVYLCAQASAKRHQPVGIDQYMKDPDVAKALARSHVSLATDKHRHQEAEQAQRLPPTSGTAQNPISVNDGASQSIRVDDNSTQRTQVDEDAGQASQANYGDTQQTSDKDTSVRDDSTTPIDFTTPYDSATPVDLIMRDNSCQHEDAEQVVQPIRYDLQLYPKQSSAFQPALPSPSYDLRPRPTQPYLIQSAVNVPIETPNRRMGTFEYVGNVTLAKFYNASITAPGVTEDVFGMVSRLDPNRNNDMRGFGIEATETNKTHMPSALPGFSPWVEGRKWSFPDPEADLPKLFLSFAEADRKLQPTLSHVIPHFP